MRNFDMRIWESCNCTKNAQYEKFCNEVTNLEIMYCIESQLKETVVIMEYEAAHCTIYEI